MGMEMDPGIFSDIVVAWQFLRGAAARLHRYAQKHFGNGGSHVPEERLKRFLGSLDILTCEAGAAHYNKPKHPDNFEPALRIYKSLGGRNMKELTVPFKRGDLFAIGGPASSRRACVVFGHGQFWGQATAPNPLNLPVYFDHRCLEGIAARYVDGQVVRTCRKGLITPDWHVLVKTNYYYMQANDYLVLTVLPNIFMSAVERSTYRLMLASGVHGLGTQAIELTLSTDKTWQALEEALNRHRFFQAVFEVNEIEHDVLHCVSRPRRVSFVGTYPLDETAILTRAETLLLT